MPSPEIIPFSAAWGLANAHAQTIWPALFRKRRRLATVREVWRRPEPEGAVDVVLLADRPEAPGVLLLHGLEGSALSPYLHGLLGAVHDAGWNAAILEFRSCGPTAPLTPQLYHSGKTDEIAFTADRLSQRWQGPVAACGFSLGGNALLKLLGEAAGSTPICGAVAVSVPFDLSACADRLDGAGFFARIYRHHFLRSLKRKACRTASQHAVPFAARDVQRARTLRSFDALVTAPLFGFTSAEDYYARNSSSNYIDRIRVPTLLLSSVDDPFIPAAAIPHDAIASNPHLTLRLFDHGGHTGFIAGRPGRLRYAVEAEAVNFLRSVFSRL